MNEVHAIKVGGLSCQICAPKGMSRAALERETNKVYLCGTTNGWMLDESIAAVTCANDSNREHWIMVC